MSSTDFLNKYIGKYVIIRAENSGVHAGILTNYCPVTRHVELTKERRIHYWEGAFTLSAVATSGIKGDSRIACLLEEIIVTEVIEIIPCTPEGRKSIEEYPVWNP